MNKLFDMSDNVITPMEIALLQSEEYADEIIRRFEQEYNGCQIPTDLLDSIVKDMNLSAEDLFPDSIKRIENTVSNCLRRHVYGVI